MNNARDFSVLKDNFIVHNRVIVQDERWSTRSVYLVGSGEFVQLESLKCRRFPSSIFRFDRLTHGTVEKG
eukprot:scaffold618_cov175-Amphora_coffeaeformis.AAC.4